MNKKVKNNHIQCLFFMPSFYGGLSWGIWLVLYLSKLIKWDEYSNLALIIFLLVEMAYITSLVVLFPYYKNWFENILGKHNGETIFVERSNYNGKVMMTLLYVLGFLGVFKYVLDFSVGFGGIIGFFVALFNNSHLIRWAAESIHSIGTQISYFGWMAISLTIFEYSRKKVSILWVLLALLMLLANLLFIDRTRPIWILFTSLLMLFPAAKKIKLKKILKVGALSFLISVLIFLGVAQWTGKIVEEGVYGSSVLPGPAQNIYFYGTSGFAYFNKLLELNDDILYMPERILYPVYKLFSVIQLTKDPPSQINDFYEVPFPTNVGTFLEPFYRDGGILFTFGGIMIYSFGLDLAGYIFLKTRKSLAIYAWANICFVSFIGFFTPKISSTPVWLFCFIGLFCFYFQRSYLVKDIDK